MNLFGVEVNWKTTTMLLLGVTVAVLAAYDTAAEIYGGNRTTISQVVYHFAQAEPIAAVAFGVLAGHLFWPQRKNNIQPLAAAPPPEEPAPGEPVSLVYRNWKGEVRVRKVRPLRLWFGATPWHPTPQYLVTALDEEGKEKDFALGGFMGPLRCPTPVPAQYAPPQDIIGECDRTGD